MSDDHDPSEAELALIELTPAISEMLDTFIIVGIVRGSDERMFLMQCPSRKEVDPALGLRADMWEDETPYRVPGRRLNGMRQLAQEWYLFGEDEEPIP